MKYLLDANAIIMLIMNLDKNLVSRTGRCDEGDIVTSAVSYAEVAYGSRQRKPPTFDELQAFLQEVPVLPFDRDAADSYALLPFRRGSYDRLIAAHALSVGLTVVTNNAAHFQDIPGLDVEDWTLPL